MLTPEQRAKISEYAAQGVAKAEIARRLEVSRATVHRVLAEESGPANLAAARTTQGKGPARALLAVLFELFEDLRELRAQCRARAADQKALERIGWYNLPGQENQPTWAKFWAAFDLKIDESYKVVERQVQDLRIDIPSLQRLYMDMLDVRTAAAWARSRAASAPDTECSERADEPEQKPSRPEEPSLLDKIIGNVKKLIIGHRP